MRSFFAFLYLASAIPMLSAQLTNDPVQALLDATVSITRYYDDEDKKIYSDPNAIGVSGTAWFLGSSNCLVTITHVANSMLLSSNQWREIEVAHFDTNGVLISWEKTQVTIAASFRYTDHDGITVLCLKWPFGGVKPLPIRTKLLSLDEEVFSIGYSEKNLSIAKGRFVCYEKATLCNTGRVGLAYFELRNGNPIALDFGSSGAPVVDQEGKVVSVVSTTISQKVDLRVPGVKPMRVSSPHGQPTNIGIPTPELVFFKGF